MAKVLKYFELPIDEAKDWNWKDYLLFIIEALYSTVFPFFSGALMVKRGELIWILMLVLPIYFRLRISKTEESQKKKRIYVK